MSEASLYVALGVAALIAATAAPPVIAVVCWTLAHRLRRSWPVHVLFVPLLFVAEWLAINTLFFAAHDDGDGPPSLGLALLPALGLIALSVCAYYCALLSKLIAELRRKA